MNLRAWRLREHLELTELECLLTRQDVGHHLITTGIGVASVGLVLLGDGWIAASGLIYFLMGPLHAAFGVIMGRRAARLAGG
jgi:hypothetical protein